MSLALLQVLAKLLVILKQLGRAKRQKSTLAGLDVETRPSTQ
ncbi:hypothetical protein [Scytonema sp. HK-05]|nr:hypothetical protein [Scytonema sp. HK-05]